MQIESSKDFPRGWRRLLGDSESPSGVWESSTGTLVGCNAQYDDEGNPVAIEYVILQNDLSSKKKEDDEEPDTSVKGIGFQTDAEREQEINNKS